MKAAEIAGLSRPTVQRDVAAYGRYHPTFADFRAAVQDVLDRVPKHAEKLASLTTRNFQELDDVSFLAA